MKAIDILKFNTSPALNEILRPNTTNQARGILVGGATFHEILAKSGDDSKYIDILLFYTYYGADYFAIEWRGLHTELTKDLGRTIARFTAIVRGQSANLVNFRIRQGVAGSFNSFPGATEVHILPSSTTDVQYGPYTKPGGGVWTKAEFDALEIYFLTDSLTPDPGLVKVFEIKIIPEFS